MYYSNGAKHISEGVESYLSQQKNQIPPANIFCLKLHNLFNGLPWGRILSISGLPSSGKSLFLEMLKSEFLKDESIEILSFELEMLIEDQIERRVKYNTLDAISNQNLHYIDKLLTPAQIIEQITAFAQSYVQPRGKKLIVTLDHTLMIKGDDEKKKIDALMQGLVELKIELHTLNIPASFVILSQLNRDIENDSRVTNPFLHYPKKSDIFAASSVFYCSDYHFTVHRPKIISGIGEYYGPPMEGYPRGLPTTKDGKDAVYVHVLKNRFGRLGVIAFYEDYENAKIIEW